MKQNTLTSLLNHDAAVLHQLQKDTHQTEEQKATIKAQVVARAQERIDTFESSGEEPNGALAAAIRRVKVLMA